MTTDNTMRAAALKPCPFCGGSNTRVALGYFTAVHGANHGGYLTCSNCGATGPDAEGQPTEDHAERAANEAWNTRADAALAAARAEGYKAGMERSAEICEGEHLEDPTETHGDMAYDNAIRHCADAIRAEIGKEGGWTHPSFPRSDS